MNKTMASSELFLRGQGGNVSREVDQGEEDRIERLLHFYAWRHSITLQVPRIDGPLFSFL